MEKSNLREIVRAMPVDRRAELFGVLIDVSEEADPTDGGGDSVSEALARREELETGEIEMLSDADFWRDLRDA